MILSPVNCSVKMSPYGDNYVELKGTKEVIGLNRINQGKLNGKEAAELLGMKPSTLTYRMKALGIIKPVREIDRLNPSAL